MEKLKKRRKINKYLDKIDRLLQASLGTYPSLDSIKKKVGEDFWYFDGTNYQSGNFSEILSVNPPSGPGVKVLKAKLNLRHEQPFINPSQPASDPDFKTVEAEVEFDKDPKDEFEEDFRRFLLDS